MNRRRWSALAIAGGAVVVTDAAFARQSTIVYKNDFEGAIGAEWSTKITSNTSGFTRFLGNFGQTTHAHLAVKTIVNAEYNLTFDFFAIDSWDGNSKQWGPDSFRVRINNVDKLYDTFSNMTMYPQSYKGPALFKNQNRGFAGADDSAYRISLAFKGTGTDADIDFFGYGLQVLVDESWGVDNVIVTRLGGGGGMVTNSSPLLDSPTLPAPGAAGTLLVVGGLACSMRPRRR